MIGKTITERRQVRMARIAELIQEGRSAAQVYGIVAAEFGASSRTIRRDIADCATLAKRRRESGAFLETLLEGCIARVHRRASELPLDSPTAQRADEWLARFADGVRGELRLKRLGAETAKVEAQLARLRVERAEVDLEKARAQTDLAEAEAALARARSERVDKPLVVVLRDLGAGVTDEDIARASPTFAGGRDEL